MNIFRFYRKAWFHGARQYEKRNELVQLSSEMRSMNYSDGFYREFIETFRRRELAREAGSGKAEQPLSHHKKA